MLASEFDNLRYMLRIGDTPVIQAGDAVLHHCYEWELEDCISYSIWLDSVPMPAQDAKYFIGQWLVDHDAKSYISLDKDSFEDVYYSIVVPLAVYMVNLRRFGYAGNM